MKHYKSVEFLSIFRMSSPRTNSKPHHRNAKPPYWKLSGDGSGLNDGSCNHPNESYTFKTF